MTLLDEKTPPNTTTSRVAAVAAAAAGPQHQPPTWRLARQTNKQTKFRPAEIEFYLLVFGLQEPPLVRGNEHEKAR